MFREGRRIRLGVPNPHFIVPPLDSSMRVIPRRGELTFPGASWLLLVRVGGNQCRKITVRCTMKLIVVAVACATTNAAVISPGIGGSNASITAFIPT